MNRWMLVLAALVLPALAQAQVHALPDAPHILVKGHAEGRYVPDRFSIWLQVSVTDMNAAKARHRVEMRVKKIIANLDRSGALPESTHATSLSITASNETRNGQEVFAGTQVQRSIWATFDSLDHLRRFIGSVPASSEVQILETKAARSDVEKIKLDLRKKAIQRSISAARSIAGAYGMKIKGVYSVSDVEPQYAYGIESGTSGTGEMTVSANAKLSLSDVVPAFRAGTITIQQDIYAVYLIRSGSAGR